MSAAEDMVGPVFLGVIVLLIVVGIIYAIYYGAYVEPKMRTFYRSDECHEMVDNYIETLPSMTEEGRTYYRENRGEIGFFLYSFIPEFVTPKAKGLPPSEKFSTSFKKALYEFRLTDIVLTPVLVSGGYIALALRFFNDYCNMRCLRSSPDVKLYFDKLNDLKLNKVKIVVIHGQFLSDLPLMDQFTSLETIYIDKNTNKDFPLDDYVENGKIKTMPNVEEILFINTEVPFRKIKVNQERYSKVFPKAKPIAKANDAHLKARIKQVKEADEP